MTQNPVIIVPDDRTLVRMADELATQAAEFRDVFLASYPVKGGVRWEYGGDIRKGVVLAHGAMGDRLLVRNDETGAEYWVHRHRVLDAIRARVS